MKRTVSHLDEKGTGVWMRLVCSIKEVAMGGYV